jgi:hypothetical protein
MMNSGSMTSESAVICHESVNMTAAVSTSWITLLTTPESVDVNARCAPSTSLLRRLTRAPVCVRVKNCSGIRWTWSYTFVRRSRMMPSPMRAEYHRWASESIASATARPAMKRARRTTVRSASDPPRVIALITSPARTGVATPITAAITTVIRNTTMSGR